MATFFHGEHEISIPFFSDIDLKQYFDQGALIIDFVGEVVILAADPRVDARLAKVKNTLLVDGHSFAANHRVLIEVSEHCLNSFVLPELQEWSWKVTAVMYDKPADKFSKSMCRTLFYESGKGKISHGRAVGFIAEFVKLTHEADLTPEHKYKFDRFYAHDVLLKNVPNKLSKDLYKDCARNLGFLPYSDAKVSEFARNFHKFPYSCDYLPAEKIAEITVHLRRAETILSSKASLYNKPRNPMDIIKATGAECYFCGVKGIFGYPPFTSFMSQVWQSQVCDDCLSKKI